MNNEMQKSERGLNKVSSTENKITRFQNLAAGHLASLKKLPDAPRMFNQLVIFLLDGSGSMTYPGKTGKSKGYEVHQSTIVVLERLQKSKNVRSFDVAFWAFANESIEMFPVKSVKEVNLQNDCFNPCEFINDHSKTLLTETLLRAYDQAKNYLNNYEGQNTKVLLIILGDGAINDYSECLELKNTISNNKDISFSSILFESPNFELELGKEALQELNSDFSNLASSHADYMSTVDPEKIRSHMIQSITKVSNVI